MHVKCMHRDSGAQGSYYSSRLKRRFILIGSGYHPVLPAPLCRKGLHVVMYECTNWSNTATRILPIDWEIMSPTKAPSLVDHSVNPAFSAARKTSSSNSQVWTLCRSRTPLEFFLSPRLSPYREEGREADKCGGPTHGIARSWKIRR